MGEETDKGLGCILWVIAFGLLIFIMYNGPAIANKLLGDC